MEITTARPTLFKNLSLTDRRVFLQLFKEAASDGPMAAADFLYIMEVIVPEGEFTLIWRDVNWTYVEIDKLALFAPDYFTL